MFLRSVTVKGHEYVLLVENVRAAGRHRQRVLRYFGRRDRLDMDAVLAFVRRVREGLAHAGGNVDRHKSG